MLRLYNTLTRKKEVFKPLHDEEVLLYTCGPTVYDYAHIGNLRAFIFDDLLKRVLEFSGFRIKHVMNFTDVGHLVSDADTGEDKMEIGAERERKTAWQIADFYIMAFKNDVKMLRIKEPDSWPRATDHVDEMIELVKKLLDNGFAYVIEDGVYFDTSRAKDYGKLARLNVKGLKAGARIELSEGKRHPTDFAIWKFSPKGKKRDMEWDSPWGKGFPGWHIECSVLAMKYLGETIDIHCGGIDHIAVHHTNEIAQSEAATGKKFANFWLHNEFMLVDRKKMAKSLGNYYTLHDLIKKGFSPLAFRYLCLSVHYKSQMNFTLDAMKDAQNTLESINNFIDKIRSYPDESERPSKKILPVLDSARKGFTQAIEDDLDTPNALAAIFDLMKAVNKELDAQAADKKSLDEVLHFFTEVNGIFDILEEKKAELTTDEKKLIELREHFRRNKDFRASDEIRRQLKEKGIILEDTPKGTTWKKVVSS